VPDEVSAGDPDAAGKRLAVVEEFELLEITKEVTDLAEAIIASGIIPQSSPTDAAHIAIATAHCMDYLMTWNCAHIANAEIFTVE
tara:strand:- start:1243 stop:1497 length:255 start_codon:yes stop_codon:yes gene_type:complete